MKKKEKFCKCGKKIGGRFTHCDNCKDKILDTYNAGNLARMNRIYRAKRILKELNCKICGDPFVQTHGLQLKCEVHKNGNWG